MALPEVYRWDSGQHYYQRTVRDKAAVAAVEEFLRAHGINPLAFVVGNELVVHEHDDGSLWLHTWRVVGNVPVTEAQTCPHCPACIEQEPVEVPLAAPVPMLPGAWVSDREHVPTIDIPAEAGVWWQPRSG
ncbi:MAG TPA: hypothetical protein VF174_09980 [Micromonosporaceae bacterium]